MKNIHEIAETIKNAQTWADVEAEIKDLCEAEGRREPRRRDLRRNATVKSG